MATSDRTNPLIALRDIQFGYPGGAQVFNGLDFDLFPGERIGGCGP